MRALRFTFGALLVTAILAGAAYLWRDKAVNFWIQHKLVETLAAAIQAEVELQEVVWQDGVLHAGRGRLSGGALPFDHLIASDLRAPVPWRHFLEAGSVPAVIEAGEMKIAWSETPPPSFVAGESPESSAWPDLDFLVTRLSLAHAAHPGWFVHETAARAVLENGQWSVAGRGGMVGLFGLPPLHLERVSATHGKGRWSIGGFAARDEQGGAVAGSAAHEEAGWSGEFSWQELDLAILLPEAQAPHFTGRISGHATLKEGILRGQAKVTDGTFRKVPLFVRMASLFMGENWDTIGWQVFRFDFTRHPDGSVDFADFQALSPQGLAIRGSGHVAPDRLDAQFQLGMERKGRPWLLAFMPAIFRAENAGYLWTNIELSGTPSEPVEDLTPRVAAAVALAPVSGAVEALSEGPGTAAEAAGRLLRGLIGR